MLGIKPFRVFLTMLLQQLLADLTTEFRAVRQERLVTAIHQALGCGAVGLLKLEGDWPEPGGGGGAGS